MLSTTIFAIGYEVIVKGNTSEYVTNLARIIWDAMYAEGEHMISARP